MSRCSVCKTLHEDNDMKSCLYCNDPGSYCDECARCNKCQEWSPGDWSCGGGSNHNLTQSGFKAKCIDCNEFYYCNQCIVICLCRKGDKPHYVCKAGYGDTHICGGDGCPAYLCKKYNSSAIDDEYAWCSKHRPVASKRLRDEIVSQIKKGDKKICLEIIEELQKVVE